MKIIYGKSSCVCKRKVCMGSSEKNSVSVWAPIVTGTRRDNAVCTHTLAVSLMVLMTGGDCFTPLPDKEGRTRHITQLQGVCVCRISSRSLLGKTKHANVRLSRLATDGFF